MNWTDRGVIFMSSAGGADRLITLTEAAKRIGVHPNTLRSWADKGLIKPVRLPTGVRRFEAGEIERIRREMGRSEG